jgi:cytochrome d ubiquinol oxidase subunit II
MALALLLMVTAYSTAGGVDFGAGIWDLLAAGGRQGRQARALIDHAMAPVWEANNVWLVLAIVLCWTAFPLLFQSVFASLYPLYSVALIGLILRGAFFAFRHVAESPRAHRAADLVFGASSVLTPFFFAASLGAIASGRVGGGSVLEASFNPMSIAFGLVSLAATAFSGATFLVGDARRYGVPDLADYFRVRAIGAAVVLIVVGTGALATIGVEAPALLRSMLLGPGLPFALVTMLATPLVLFVLLRRAYTWYRVLTVAAVGSMVFAWGFAMSPELLPGRLTIPQAAAPSATLGVLLGIVVALVVLVAPSLALLYHLDQKSALESPEQPMPWNRLGEG